MDAHSYLNCNRFLYIDLADANEPWAELLLRDAITYSTNYWVELTIMELTIMNHVHCVTYGIWLRNEIKPWTKVFVES